MLSILTRNPKLYYSWRTSSGMCISVCSRFSVSSTPLDTFQSFLSCIIYWDRFYHFKYDHQDLENNTTLKFLEQAECRHSLTFLVDLRVAILHVYYIPISILYVYYIPVSILHVYYIPISILHVYYIPISILHMYYIPISVLHVYCIPISILHVYCIPISILHVYYIPISLLYVYYIPISMVHVYYIPISILHVYYIPISILHVYYIRIMTVHVYSCYYIYEWMNGLKHSLWILECHHLAHVKLFVILSCWFSSWE